MQMKMDLGNCDCWATTVCLHRPPAEILYSVKPLLNFFTQKWLTTCDELILSKAFTQILADMSESGVVNPGHFKETFGSVRKDFEGIGQKDAMECFEGILQHLHEELKSVNKDTTEGRTEETIISTSFQSTVASDKTCKKCLTVTQNVDQFSVLRLPWSCNAVITKELHLEDCLAQYGSNVDDWFCSNCHALQLIDLKRSFIQCPSVLTIQLPQVNQLMKFPLRNLDLKSLCNTDAAGSAIYDLMCIINHTGTSEAGHYTVSCKRDGRWIHMDDTKLTWIEEDDIATPDACALVYTKITAPRIKTLSQPASLPRSTSQDQEYLLLNIPSTSKDDLLHKLKMGLGSKLKANSFMSGRSMATFTCTDKLTCDEWDKIEGQRMALIHKKSQIKVECSKRVWSDLKSVWMSSAAKEKVMVTWNTYSDVGRSKFQRAVLSGSWMDLVVLLDHLQYTDHTEKGSGKATTDVNGDNSEICSICLEMMTSSTILECGDKFCEHCIEETFKTWQPKCPICGLSSDLLKGNQPPGEMIVYTAETSLPGNEGYSTIVLEYVIPGGIQDASHPNPGVQFNGTHEVAYLPDNQEGREVSELLQKAFHAGLTFTVGRSGELDNQVIWSGIQHKTSEFGPCGYPDADYLVRVKEELKAKGITSDQ